MNKRVEHMDWYWQGRTEEQLNSSYLDQHGRSGKFVKNSTKLTCFEITVCRIKYGTVLGS